jgi:hypothetical protein
MRVSVALLAVLLSGLLFSLCSASYGVPLVAWSSSKQVFLPEILAESVVPSTHAVVADIESLVNKQVRLN